MLGNRDKPAWKDGCSMPNYFAHLIFGAKMLKQLPEEAAAPIRAQREAFNLGCLGPDPLFFYRPALPNAARREGLEMHHESAAPVFARLARALGNGVPQAEGYAAGFLCHFALDAACHPYVNSRVAESTVAHLAMEAELDRALMENRGLSARGQVYLPPVREEAVFAAGERAYLWAGADELRRGYAAMRRDSLLFARGHGTRLGVTVNRMVALLPACRSLRGVILPSSYLPERETFCRALIGILQEESGTAAEKWLEFQRYVRNGGRLSFWFHRDFNGRSMGEDRSEP